MDKIAKALSKLSAKERERVRAVLQKLFSGKITGLDIKKLKDENEIFRVRSGGIRIIYRKDKKNEVFVLSISRRNERTYRDL
jgi:mRNA-degrading endonuclease RelE of RelBE toxin-antitoxin system